MALSLTTRVRTRLTAWGVAFVALLGSAFGALFAGTMWAQQHEIVVLPPLLVALGATLIATVVGLVGVPTEDELTVTDGGVDFKVAKGFARRKAEILRSTILHEPDGTYVRLGSTLTDLDVRVEDDEAAKKLLGALDIDATGREAVALWGWRPDLVQVVLAAVSSVFGAGLLSIFTRGAWSFALPLLAILIPLLAGALRLLRGKTTMTIGDDGLQVTNAFGGSRFVAHREIASVRADDSELHVVLQSGEDLRFTGFKRVEDGGALGRHLSDVAARILRHRDNRPESAEAPALARAGRTTRDWLDALKRIGKEIEPSFRSASIPRDVLWRVVESVDSPEDERIAAAVALRTGGLVDDDKPRLRVAVESCAHDDLRERLRVALESEEDEALEKALEPLAKRSARL